jgi:hypothetical protein
MITLTQSETEQIAAAIFSAIENIGQYPSESFKHIIDNVDQDPPLYAEVVVFVQIQRFKGDNVTPPGYSQELRWISVNELYYGEERAQSGGVQDILNGWVG